MEAQYKDYCKRLGKENSHLQTENEQLRTNIEIMKAATFENSQIFAQNSERETMVWVNKGLKEDIKKKDGEILELKTHLMEHEREVAKLKEKLKYLKESSSKRIHNENEDLNEASWKDTCIVLTTINT